MPYPCTLSYKIFHAIRGSSLENSIDTPTWCASAVDLVKVS
ncbi:hypothetical protein [Rubritalea tangerina]